LSSEDIKRLSSAVMLKVGTCGAEEHAHGLLLGEGGCTKSQQEQPTCD